MPTRSADTMERPKNKKCRISITSSGRASRTPKKLLSTSEDEVQPKRKKGITTIAQQKERLRNLLNTIRTNGQELTRKVDCKENVSPNPISVKSRRIPLKGTQSHSTYKAKINDSESATLEASPNRNKSSTNTMTSSYLEYSSTDSASHVSIQQIDPQVSERQTIEKDIEPSVELSTHKNYQDTNNFSVEIPKTARLLTSNHTTESCRKSSDHEEPASARPDQRPPKQLMGLDQPPASSLNLEKLMTNILEQNAEIILQIENIQKQNKEMKELIIEELIQKNEGEAKLSETLFEPLQGFPLETVEQFNELDSNRKLRKNLYNHLKTRGATKLREFIHKSLRATMTDKLASQFKWLGDATTPKLGNTRVTNVLYVAAKNCPYFSGPRDTDEFKSEMLDVLRCVKQRYRNSKKKMVNQKKQTKNKAPLKQINNKQQENEDFNSHVQDDINNLSADEIASELTRLENMADSEAEMSSDSVLGDNEFSDNEFGND